MKIEVFPTGDFEANCVILSDGGIALVADPGADAEEIDTRLARLDLTVAAYLITHGHADHVSAIGSLCAKRSAPVLMHHDDLQWAFSNVNEILPYYAAPRKPTCPIEEVKDGSAFTFGAVSMKVIATPGHSPGCVCYYFENDGVLISGDTLFRGSVGRTDLPGGDGRTLTKSLLKLAALPPSTKIYPGHGDSSTIGEELRSNYFMQTAARSLRKN